MSKNNNVNTNYPNKGLHLDYSDFTNSKEIWTYARNTTVHSQNGDLLHLQNEPSPVFCVDIPYNYIGHIPVKDNKKIIFTTDNTNSEIGILDSEKCTYNTIINATCLNFNTNNPITGSYKYLTDCGDRIYWTDGNRNEVRYLDLGEVPYTFTTANDDCETKTFSTDLDCNQLAFTKNIKIPCTELTARSSGSLPNGSYQIAVAYKIGTQRATDYFSTTNPVQIWSHNNNGGSLNLKLTNLDTTFDEYQLLLISTFDNGQTEYAEFGTYNTSQKNHTIVNKTKATPVQQEELSIKRPYYEKAGSISTNDQFLILQAPTTKPRLNYQPQAMSIVTEYVVYEAPLDYYASNNNVGYYRDEVYGFGIQWLYTDGQWSDAFHIPGRAATERDLQTVSGNDIIDIAVDCENVRPNKRWEVYNTASEPEGVAGSVVCNARMVGKGTMSYWESTEKYKDRADLYGDLACTPIRLPKFPDECKVPRQTGNKINILGVQFSNIKHPVDENGNKIVNISGYRILRTDRTGNRSVIARGMFSNVRSYQEDNEVIRYTNYPYNYTGPDPYLSDTQTFNKAGGEENYNALTTVHNDELNFYSPHTLFDRVTLGDYVQFESSTSATVTGKFEDVNKHPNIKLLRDRALWTAIIIGAIDGYLRAFSGKRCEFDFKNGQVTVTSGTPPQVATTNVAGLSSVNRCNDILEGGFGNLTQGFDITDPTSGDQVHYTVLKAVSTLSAIGAFAYYTADTAQKVLDIIYNTGGWKNYTKQYNSKALFDRADCVREGNKRRTIDNYQYLGSGVNSLEDGTEYNNLYREDNVYIKLGANIDLLSGDNSLKTIHGFGICENTGKKVTSTARMYYGTVKNYIPGQYGQLDTFTYVKTSSCHTSVNIDDESYTTDPLFGGDCYMNLFSVNNRTDFFSHPLFDVPDGFDYDYREYKAIAYPRYWTDSSPYDVMDLVPADLGSASESNLPRQKYNLDCDTANAFSFVKDEYMYTSVNGVICFIAESDYNLDNRDWNKPTAGFYTKNSNLSKLFENKGEVREYEEFVYDKSYSKYNDDEFNYQQALDFDIAKESCFTGNPNTIAYSLASTRNQNYDNWLTFLPNDVDTFDQTTFGNLTSIHLVDGQRLLYLFDKASPFITNGRTQLQGIDGTEIYLGTGSLLQNPYPTTYTEDYYGNCQSKFAIKHTKFGLFYPSQRKGNWFKYNQGLDEISRNGVFYFFDKYLPSQLLEQFPDYPHTDNPYNGIGLLSAYDPSYEMMYLTKKDYCLKEEYKDQITYDSTQDSFLLGNTPIALTNDTYFEDASWTVSYSPSLKSFISFHDYHPNGYIPTENHFLAVNGTKIWKHNENCQSYSNFYGVDYPHSFTLPINNGQTTAILRNVEYHSQVFNYSSNCHDKYHVLNATYDKALIYNSEQASGWLNLLQRTKPSDSYKYSKSVIGTNNRSFDILYDKDEQKYSFNMFKDIVKDRDTNIPLITTDCSGYKWDVNNDALNYKKIKRAKIRHTQSKVHFEKTVSDNNKYVFYLSNDKQLNSP